MRCVQTVQTKQMKMQQNAHIHVNEMNAKANWTKDLTILQDELIDHV